jgi:hypothetical protein
MRPGLRAQLVGHRDGAEVLQSPIELRNGHRDLIATHRMPGIGGLALELGSGQTQRFEQARALWIVTPLERLGRALPLTFFHPLLESRFGVD